MNKKIEYLHPSLDCMPYHPSPPSARSGLKGKGKGCISGAFITSSRLRPLGVLLPLLMGRTIGSCWLFLLHLMGWGTLLSHHLYVKGVHTCASCQSTSPSRYASFSSGIPMGYELFRLPSKLKGKILLFFEEELYHLGAQTWS